MDATLLSLLEKPGPPSFTRSPVCQLWEPWAKTWMEQSAVVHVLFFPPISLNSMTYDSNAVAWIHLPAPLALSHLDIDILNSQIKQGFLNNHTILTSWEGWEFCILSSQSLWICGSTPPLPETKLLSRVRPMPDTRRKSTKLWPHIRLSSHFLLCPHFTFTGEARVEERGWHCHSNRFSVVLLCCLTTVAVVLY